jgi:hypothetical protein
MYKLSEKPRTTPHFCAHQVWSAEKCCFAGIIWVPVGEMTQWYLAGVKSILELCDSQCRACEDSGLMHINSDKKHMVSADQRLRNVLHLTTTAKPYSGRQ